MAHNRKKMCFSADLVEPKKRRKTTTWWRVPHVAAGSEPYGCRGKLMILLKLLFTVSQWNPTLNGGGNFYVRYFTDNQSCSFKSSFNEHLPSAECVHFFLKKACFMFVVACYERVSTGILWLKSVMEPKSVQNWYPVGGLWLLGEILISG